MKPIWKRNFSENSFAILAVYTTNRNCVLFRSFFFNNYDTFALIDTHTYDISCL